MNVFIGLAIVVTPFYVAAHVVEASVACPTVSAAPAPAKGPAKAAPGRTSTLGYASFSGAPSQSLAESRCAFDSNLTHVSAAQSTMPSQLEATITDFTSSLFKRGAFGYALIVIGWSLSSLYYWINRYDSSDRNEEGDEESEDHLPALARLADAIRRGVRLSVGPIAWLILALSIAYSSHAMAALQSPSHAIVALSTKGPLSPSKLSANMYRVAEVNALGNVMYGLNSKSELSSAAPNLDAIIKGKPVTKVAFQELSGLYKGQLLTADQAGSMQRTADSVKRVATTLNTDSTIASQVVMLLRPLSLGIFSASCFLLVLLTALRPVRAFRFFRRWLVANLAITGLLTIGLGILLLLNWGGLYAATYLTTPGKQGVMAGWGAAAYAFQVVGYIAPWFEFISIYLYYRVTSGRILSSMCNSEDKWVQSLGKRLTLTRERRVFTRKLLQISPRYRRRQLVALK